MCLLSRDEPPLREGRAHAKYDTNKKKKKKKRKLKIGSNASFLVHNSYP
jgi:hypothetical protein